MVDVAGTVVGRYQTYPDTTRRRACHGGLRTLGQFKRTSEEFPLVTVITVCLNSAETIENCIRSVRDQTHENVEYIVVDGGSADGTVDIIQKHSEFIDYFVSEPDRGLYHAMNKGIESATGEIFKGGNALSS